MLFMRIRTMFLAPLLPAVAAAFFPGGAAAAGGAGAVALQYHFAGAANLAGNTNFDNARKIFSLPPARRYQDLVLDRLAGVFWKALDFESGANPSEVLRPLLNDLLQTESQGSFGGSDKSRMDFVLAARLDDKRAQAWQKGLEKALRSKGKAWTAEGFSGRSWNRPGNYAFWMLRAGDWLVVGRGDGLQAVRAEYLQHLRQDEPAPAGHEGELAGGGSGLAIAGGLGAAFQLSLQAGANHGGCHRRRRKVSCHRPRLLPGAGALAIPALAHSQGAGGQSPRQFRRGS